MGALRRDPRATETEPRKSGGRTRDPEGERGKSRNAMWAGRRRENRRGRRQRELERTGRKEREQKGRKPEETEEEAEENVTEPATGKTQPRQSTIPRRYARKGKRDWNWKRCGERSGENRTQGRGRNGGKHEQTRAERSVEEVVSDRGEEW